MTPERYHQLMETPEAELTQEEFDQGWHFCCEFDGLLVGPGMPEVGMCQHGGPLTFQQFRKANEIRSDHPGFSKNRLKLDQWAILLGGELGEFLDLWGKWSRGRISTEEFLPEAGKELADIVTFVDLICMKLEIDLETVLREKFNEVSDRVGCAVKL